MYLIDILKNDYAKHRAYRKTSLHPVRSVKKTAESYKAKQQKLIDEFYNGLSEYKKSNSTDIAPPDKKLEGFRILSFNGDRMGKVIMYNGGIYRGIYKESVPAFKKLWETGLLQMLGIKGYIPKTEVTPYYTDDFPIILSHETVTMSASSLWNDRMILDALLLICLIKQLALKSGFTLHDGHLNNVTFHNGRPVFTDIGSIVENKGQATICDREILFTGCYRLISRLVGSSILKHIQLYDESNNMIWVGSRSYNDMVREYDVLLKAYLRYHLFHSGIRCFWLICRLFKAYDVRAEYIYALFDRSVGSDDGTNDKTYSECEHLLDALRSCGLAFSDITEVSGSGGAVAARVYSELQVPVSAIEADERNAEKAYGLISRKELPVNVYCFNYLYGTDEKILRSLTSDLVIGLDISNSCMSYQNYYMDSVLNSLNKLTRSYIACTYHPLRKLNVKYQGEVENTEKAISSFDSVFERFFETVDKRVYEGDTPDDCFVLYIGRKKTNEDDLSDK